MDLKEIVESDIEPRMVNKDVDIHESITIMAEPHTLYSYFIHPSQFTELIEEIQKVRETSDFKSLWIGRDKKRGLTAEWENEILEAVPDRRIVWKTMHNEQVILEGQIEFDELPFSKGTRIHVKIDHDLQASRFLEALELAVGESPRKKLRHFLKSFRQMIETGEISTTQGQPVGDGKTEESFH